MTAASQAQTPRLARRRNPCGEGARLREEIITAASQIIGETGDDTALTLRGVARRLGIAAPSIYRHFTDVDELKMAVVRRSFAEFAQARDAATAADDDPSWLAAQVWAALHGLVLLRLNAPGFPWPGPLEQMADQAVARLIGLQTPADRHPA
jgi:AcrR family transcriptional regulator